MAPITGGDTTYNKGLREIFSRAQIGAYTIQNNGFIGDLYLDF